MDAAFYRHAPVITRFVDVSDVSRYAAVPASWVLIVTDVEGSTRAIEAGRYKDVNAVGVASIVAVKNALGGMDVPFVFGGDGATFLVPQSALTAVEPALRGTQEMARDAFDLSLRAGRVGVKELADANAPILVARYQANEDVSYAMFAGPGLSVGETWIKSKERGPALALSEQGPSNADFTGFECRWKPIPSRNGLTASLLVHARDTDSDAAATTYHRFLEMVDEVAGQTMAPVEARSLELERGRRGFETEARIQARGRDGLRKRLHQLKTRLLARAGRTVMATGISAAGMNGATYKSEVAANTDYRKFDDTLRMVLDLTQLQLDEIKRYLETELAAGRLFYGVSTAREALMTCFIGTYQGNHMHFVDGGDGGYAIAAKQLKAQMKQAAT